MRILVVDDEESIRKLLTARFQREGWEVQSAEDGTKALAVAATFDPEVVLTDIKMPGLDGFQLVEALRSKNFDCPVVMITGHGEKECAIEAVRKGAFDYLEKPFDMDEIALVVKRAGDRENLRRSNRRLIKDLEAANLKLESKLEVTTELYDRASSGNGGIVSNSNDPDRLLLGVSAHIQSLKTTARTLAESFVGKNDPVVLVTGESGVGKEMVARYMHAIAFRSVKESPFVGINCAAFPDNLLESELFGYERGAFTGATARKMGLFELANGGTLFLDEIGELDLKMQAKLLRVLQERVIRRLGGTSDIPVKPHIIAATNRDLAKMVAEKTFREDLYYRLNTLPVAAAPLRSRPEDVELLANHFLKEVGALRGKKFTGFSQSALKALTTYRWPGNVRELKSVIERAAILEKGPQLELSHLRQEHLHAAQLNQTKEVTAPQVTATASTADDNVISFPSNLVEKGLSDLRKEMDEKLTRQVLMEALGKERGNVSSVARILKLDRANLLRLLKRFAIDPELYRTTKQAS